MTGVDLGRWLSAVVAHPETIVTDARVALALASGASSVGPRTGPGCTGAYHCADCLCEAAVTPEAFDDSVEALVDLDFLSVAVRVD